MNIVILIKLITLSF